MRPAWLAGCFPSHRGRQGQPSHGTLPRCSGTQPAPGKGICSLGGTHGCPRTPASPLGQALPDGCCLRLRSCLLHALGSPGGAGSTRPPSAWRRQHGQCRQPGKSSVAEEVLGSHPPLSVAPGLSLGDFQHCSFHFSAAGEEAYGRLKGINDA